MSKRQLMLFFMLSFLVILNREKVLDKFEDNYCAAVSFIERLGFKAVCKCGYCKNRFNCDVYYENV